MMTDRIQDPDGATEEYVNGGDYTADSARWLRTNGGASSLAMSATVPHEPLFPEIDEIFRGIYTRAGTGFATEVIAVCSAIAGEGKTTVGVGLAVTIAQDFPDRRVLLVETDLQRPVLADDFGVEASPGLMDSLVYDEPWLSACRPTYLANLHIVPAGEATSQRGRPLRSSRMASVVDAMRQNYDMVILDLPPILVNSDAVLLTDLADGVICVVRAGVTPMNLVSRAVEQLEDSKLRGFVINGTKTALPGWLRRLAGV
jgi:capsular exopolysaccharide synthesis family protein